MNAFVFEVLATHISWHIRGQITTLLTNSGNFHPFPLLLVVQLTSYFLEYRGLQSCCWCRFIWPTYLGLHVLFIANEALVLLSTTRHFSFPCWNCQQFERWKLQVYQSPEECGKREGNMQKTRSPEDCEKVKATYKFRKWKWMFCVFRMIKRTFSGQKDIWLMKSMRHKHYFLKTIHYWAWSKPLQL